MTKEEVNAFFDEIMESDTNEMKGLEVMFDRFYHIFKGRDYKTADFIINEISIGRFDLSRMLGFLSLTLMFKSQLPSRESLYEKISVYVNEKYPERAVILLKGLK